MISKSERFHAGELQVTFTDHERTELRGPSPEQTPQDSGCCTCPSNQTFLVITRGLFGPGFLEALVLLKVSDVLDFRRAHTKKNEVCLGVAAHAFNPSI